MAVTSGRRHLLRLKVDAKLRARGVLQRCQQSLHSLSRQLHRQQPVLQAVVEKDVAEARGDHRADAVVVERPDSVLARGTAGKIAVRNQMRAARYSGRLSTN